MDPLFDERMILSNSAVMADLFNEFLGIECSCEAYGPTANEGICYEFCAQSLFKGKLKGSFFLGMDGYTKILLLPYFSNKIKPDRSAQDINTSLVIIFVNHVIDALSRELQEFNSNFSLDSTRLCSHELIALPNKKYRKYVSIFFLKDEEKEKYLGRVYTTIAILK